MQEDGTDLKRLFCASNNKHSYDQYTLSCVEVYKGMLQKLFVQAQIGLLIYLKYFKKRLKTPRQNVQKQIKK